MVAGCVYGYRQMQTWRAGSGLSCRCRLVRNPRCDHRHSYSDTPENRNDAQRAPSARPGLLMPIHECAQSGWVLIVKSGVFLVEFDEGDGLKNRRLGQCKMWIRQVLISRTLTDCDEVAERLKAAVC